MQKIPAKEVATDREVFGASDLDQSLKEIKGKKFMDYVNVKDFSGANDVEKFNNAITFLKNNNLKTLFIPYDEYLINDIIKIPSNINIISENAVLQAESYTGTEGGSYPQLIFENEDTTNGNENIKIEGLVFRGIWKDENGSIINTSQEAYNNTEASPLVNFKNVDNLIMNNCEIKNHISNYVSGNDDLFVAMHTGQSKNLYYNNIKHTNSRIESPNWVECENLNVNNYYGVNEDTWSNIKMWYCNNVNITDSIFIDDYNKTKDNWSGSTIDLFCNNLKMENCYIKGGKGIGLDNERDEKDFIINDVVFDKCYIETLNSFISSGGFVHETFYDKLTIKNCNIKSVDTGLQMRRINNLTLKNNKINLDNKIDYNNYGISLNNVKKCNIENNYINSSVGIYIPLRDFKIENYNIENNKIILPNLGTGSSYYGMSTGIYIKNNSVDTFSDIDRLIINNNEIINAEGGFISFIWNNNSILNINEIIIKNNKFESTANSCERNLLLSYIKNLKIKNNYFKNMDTSNINNIENTNINNNSFFIIDNTNPTEILNISNITGLFVIKNNFINSDITLINNDLGSFNPTYNIVKNNYPDIYSSIQSTVGGYGNYRPTNPEIGHNYYDTTLSKPIWWDGSNWVDSSGTTV
jgi:DNA-binding cell septation regulator SpoVG